MNATSTLMLIGTMALALAAQAADNDTKTHEPATNKAWKVAPSAAASSAKTNNGNFKMSGDGSVRPSSAGGTKINDGALLPAKPGNSGATKVNEGALLPAVRSPNAATKATKATKVENAAMKQ